MTMSTLYALSAIAQKTCSGLFCALGLVFLTTTTFGQSAGLQSEVGDLSGKSWKSGVALTTTIAEEKVNAGTAIASVEVHPDDKDILTFYVAVLDRLEVHLLTGAPVHDALPKAFNETTVDAANNVSLKRTAPETVYPLMHLLLEKLQEVPVYVPASN